MVKLRNVGLSQTYRRNLRDAGSGLLMLVQRLGGSLSMSTPPQKVDFWLEKAVEAAHEEGERLYWVTLGVLGLQRKLKLSGPLLRGTWKAIQGWRSLKPTRSRIPITMFCLEGIIIACLKEGWKADGRLRRQWWATGLALWLGFTGLLRPAEVLGLRIGDVSFSSTISGREVDPGMVVVVRSPKTKRIWHRQFVLCRDHRLECWMKWWVAGRSRGKSLFGLTRYTWTKYFNLVLEDLQLHRCGFTLGSLRAGGATNHFRQFGNLGTLQFLGRWTSSNTMQFYLQEAFSMHVESSLNDTSVRMLETLHMFTSLLDTPPFSPCNSLVR